MSVKKDINIDNFEKMEKIGHGSFSFIYKVTEKKTGEIYAAKVLIRDESDTYDEMAANELSIMSYINHPTVVRFIGYSNRDFNYENNDTFIMELAENGSLEEVINKCRKGLHPREYNNTIRQIILIGISRGLKCLHDRDIVHNDISSSNILLNKSFHPLISGFTLSYFEGKGSNVLSGTLIYMAPEKFKEIDFDRKSDIYSLGILMYEIVTESHPYPDLLNKKMKMPQFYRKKIEEDYCPQFNTPVNPKLRQLIEKCWSNDPKNRPSIDEIFRKITTPDYFVEKDVDADKVNEYIEKITEINDPTEKLLLKMSIMETEKNQLEEKVKEQEKLIQKLQQEINELKKK